ncbi:hypothetical protein tb265_08440 [Gemmatimonadetes bacterium T265]|nr:hypothetical protein tb265_08440 [Gemmatimonadetes bacterium T265]
MSDHRYTAIFGGAVLTAGLATFAVYRIVGPAATPRHEPVRAVVVALRDVPAGVPVPREALGVVSWPVRVAPPESFVAADSVAGRVTRVSLASGEPVLVSRLALRGAAPGLEGTIDPSRRAMAVRVNEAAGVSGLVRANSRVDVLMATRGQGAMQPTGRVLMTDVRVLGVGSVRPPESQPGAASEPPPANNATASIVTLEVTPPQAALLAAAEGEGAIQVVLRGYGSAGDVAGYPPNVAGAAVSAGVAPAWPASGAPHGMGSGGPPSAVPPVPVARRVPRAPVPEVAGATPARAADSVPARAESNVVHVYRGGALTVLRLDAPDATSSAPAAAPHQLHTADASIGTGARAP